MEEAPSFTKTETGTTDIGSQACPKEKDA
jgi:hypothetical protein